MRGQDDLELTFNDRRPAAKVEVRERGRGSFEYERDEPLDVDDIIGRGTMAYRVENVLPGYGKFDGVVEVVRFIGPGRQG